jgi:translation initiation factor IF-3
MAKEGDPLVCRLLNHGKHIFDAKKQKGCIKKETKKTTNKRNKI